jgi:aryl-alcohol dehydrogenase-like predicted oxidoreductase
MLPTGVWHAEDMDALGHVCLGSWSGGRHMHFGEPLDDDRLAALLRPDAAIDSVVTSDAYGAGAADELVGRALQGLDRGAYRLAGAVGHDFYSAARDGARGYPRFTDPALRGPEAYGDYLRMAVERSLERCGTDHFDLLLLHNPDRIGYSSQPVWDALVRLRDEGLAKALGVAPGPANGFTLDVIRCVERFGDVIDWAMVILNPLEPWPGQLVLPVCAKHGVKVLARVVDYGGIFYDDLRGADQLRDGDHRAFRPQGWVDAGRARMERMRPIAERHGLTMLQLACQWNLAQAPVASVVPTLIQERGDDVRTVESKRAELAAVPRQVVLTPAEVAELSAIGDNANCMALKGGSPVHEGAERADAWPLDDDLRATAAAWGIDPDRDLVLR